MPSQILHVLVGRAAMEKSGIESGYSDLTSFNMGCQGPDVFSHNRRTKPFALAYSRLLHRHGYGSFCAHFGTLLTKKRNIFLDSWFYGFITHQIVDRIFHPYIVYRSYFDSSLRIEGANPSHMHAFFERILDARVVEEIAGLPLTSFDTDSLFALTGIECDELASLIGEALAQAYPEDFFEGDERTLRIVNAFADTLNFYRISNPVMTDMDNNAGCGQIRRFVELGIRGVALLYPQHLSVSVDWLNAAEKKWRHPITGELRYDSVASMFRQSIDRASDMIRIGSAFIDGLVATSEFENAIGNECLSASGNDGKIGNVRFSAPFDLEKTLLDQARLRQRWLTRELS